MSNYRTRAMEEYTELNKKITKLKEFLCSDKSSELPEIEIADLKEQLKHMERYKNILSCRVSRMCNNS